MDPRLAPLDELVGELESLLGTLDAAEPGARPAAVAWERCQAAFARFRDLQAAHTAEVLPDPVRARMEDALRLHAIAASSVQRARLGVEDELRHLRQARERLRSARHQTAESRSCDVRG